MADVDDESRGEVLDFRPGPPRRSLRVLVVCVLIVLAGGLALWGAGQFDGSTPAPTPPPPTLPTPASAPASGPVEASAVREQRSADTAWLDARSDYGIFLRSDTAVYRVQPRAGVVVRTPVPPLQSGGPVAFVPTRHGVLVHPWDVVAAYDVPDDGPAGVSSWRGGVVLPGPDLDHVWIQPGEGQARLVLTDPTGQHSAATMLIPAGLAQVAAADGQGYALVSGIGGWYSLRPGGVNRIINGDLLAVGPTRALVSHCDAHAVCHAVLLDHRFATVRSLPEISLRNPVTGVISPDGRLAALADSDTGRLVVITLDTGESAVPSPVPIDGVLTDLEQLAFSPDGRWLFAVDAAGRVHAVDLRTGAVHDLLPQASGIRQVAVRA